MKHSAVVQASTAVSSWSLVLCLKETGKRKTIYNKRVQQIIQVHACTKSTLSPLKTKQLSETKQTGGRKDKESLSILSDYGTGDACNFSLTPISVCFLFVLRCSPVSVGWSLPLGTPFRTTPLLTRPWPALSFWPPALIQILCMNWWVVTCMHVCTCCFFKNSFCLFMPLTAAHTELSPR